MPRESIQIPLDKIGIITNIDAKDIPDHYVTDSLNLDPDAPIGTVKSIKDLGSDMTTVGTYAAEYAKLEESTISEVMITSENKTTVFTDKAMLEDWYGVAAGTTPTFSDITDMSVNNAELRVCRSTADRNNAYVGYNKGKRLGGIKYFRVYESPDNSNWTSYRFGELLTTVNTSDKFVAVVNGYYTGTGTDLYIYYMFDAGKWYAGLTSPPTHEITDDEIKNGYELGNGLRTRPLYITGTFTDTTYFKIHLFMINDMATFISVDAELTIPQVAADYAASMTETWVGFAQGTYNAYGGAYATGYWLGFGKTDGNDQPIDKDSWYRYKFSLIYDGVQESPLSTEYKEIYLKTYSPSFENLNYLQIRIDCYPTYITGTGTDEVWFRNRVTGIKLYRSRRSNDDGIWSAYYEVGMVDLLEPVAGVMNTESVSYLTFTFTAYALVQMNSAGTYELTDDLASYDYNKAYYGGSGDAYKPASGGNDYRQSYIHCLFIDNNTLGPSYEENTGYSEDIETTRLDYQLTEIFNGANYVSRIKDNADLTVDGQFAIIKSKDGCLDMFNYFDNIMRLPEPPRQIKAFNNRLFAFGKNKLYVINPNLFIEDTMEGVGISLRKTSADTDFGLKPVVTDYGMFWSGMNGAYWHNGKEIIEITDVIKDTFNATFNASGSTYKSICYNTEKKCILFGYIYTTDYYIWAFHIPTKQWFKWTLYTHTGNFTCTAAHLFSGNENDTYWIHTIAESGGTTVYNVKKLFASTTPTYMAGNFTSKEYGQDLQYKKWYRLNTESSGAGGYSITKTATFDDGSPVPITTTDLSKAKNKKMKFKLSWDAQNTTATIIKAIEIIFRKLIGYR